MANLCLTVRHTLEPLPEYPTAATSEGFEVGLAAATRYEVKIRFAL
jgi:hypothetical protein